MESLINFSQHADLLIELAIDAAALIGFLFFFRALIKLKIYGEMRSMMAPHARVNQILLLLFTGVLLVYLPGATREVFRDALLGPILNELPYGNTQPLYGEIQVAAEKVMSLIGTVALIRGIVQLGSYQEGGRHSLGKSITHIVAGICAINMNQTRYLLSSLVGVN